MNNTQKEELAAKFLKRARNTSRQLAKKLRKCGVVPDIEELESDANLFLAKAIDGFKDKQTQFTESYFVCGLNTWCNNQLQDRLKKYNGRSVEVESLPEEPGEDFSYLDFDPIEGEENRKELESEAGKEACGKDLKLLIRCVLDEGWDREKLIEAFGRKTYYSKLRPALARLLGIEVPSE